MRAFIASVEHGYGDRREAAAAAVRSVGGEVVRAEALSARPDTPQQACLAAVRQSDVVVLVMGTAYGARQSSGLSATHEEWKEAQREGKPVLAFIEDVEERQREPLQVAFVQEVEDWTGGHFRETFSSAMELQEKVTKALLGLANGTASIDADELRSRAEAALPTRRPEFSGRATIAVSVASGPRRQVLRPSAIEDRQLATKLQQDAMFSANAPLDRQSSTEARVENGVLCIRQNSAWVALGEDGTLVVAQSAIRDHGDRAALPTIITEDLREAIERALRFAANTLDQIDPNRRLTHVLVLAVVTDAGDRSWRTRAEHARSPNSASFGGDPSGVVVPSDPSPVRRDAFLNESSRIAQDLTVLLRREAESRLW